MVRSASVSGSPLVALRGRVQKSSPMSERPEVRFFLLLREIPQPYEWRLLKFRELIEGLHREQLLTEGLLTESRRASVKVQPRQVELVLKLALAMRHHDFGLVVE